MQIKFVAHQNESTRRGLEEQAHFNLGGTSLRKDTTWTFSGYPMFLYREPARRVIILAALPSWRPMKPPGVHPRVFQWMEVKVRKHDRSVSVELTPSKDHIPVEDRVFVWLSYDVVCRHAVWGIRRSEVLREEPLRFSGCLFRTSSSERAEGTSPSCAETSLLQS